uniref:Uncharacterized protein n=1 Tax=Anguilla anguilla TaxID=7936 RepID=A0A0E9VF24_ANGAN
MCVLIFVWGGGCNAGIVIITIIESGLTNHRAPSDLTFLKF